MYSPFWGGAELAIKEITDRISSDEIEFDMITLRADAQLPRVERVGNITVYRVGPARKGITYESLVHSPWYLIKTLYPLLASWKAHSLHRHKPYDTMWCLMTYMGFPAVLARMFGMRVPFVLTLQDGDTFSHITKRLRIKVVSPLLKKVFRDATRVQVISNYLGTFAKQMGYKGEPFLIPNGASVSEFLKSDIPSEQIRAEWGFSSEDIVLVSTSRLVHKNALDIVIQALPLIPKKVHFINLGLGPDRQKLEKLAEDLGVAHRVHLLDHPGLKKLPSYLRASDIFIRPSRSEGFGTSFIEAMAAEIPVIATQVGGIADFLFDAHRNPDVATTGFAVDVDSPEDIARTVQHILDSPDEVQTVVRNARKMVVEKYDWDVIARDIARVLHIT
jgi:glycosyltransferase involved in cell wall biosynthesis